MSKVASFEIRYTQYLGHNGEIIQELPEFARDPADLIPQYRAMVLTRAFDSKAIALQRTGKLGTYASSLGQEAIGVALGTVMQPEDVLLTSYREYGAQFLRGVSMTEILLYWGGDERGMDFAAAREDFPITVPVGSHACHAVGVATAFKLRQQARVAVCVLGDGATSKGDFYEAINLAGAWRLPTVFVINNNQWAISVPRSAQTGAETLAQKAIAAGFAGEQVDGNDIIALQEVIARTMNKARLGGGPTLIEAITYRLCDHTTADDASRYRSAEEVERAKDKEPIRRLHRFLARNKVWHSADQEELVAECSAKVDAAVEAYLKTPPQPATAMFDYLYARLPSALLEQREEVRSRGVSDA